MVESNNVGLVLRLFLGGVVVGITSSASHFCGTSSITFIPWLPSLVVDARCSVVSAFSSSFHFVIIWFVWILDVLTSF
jgi:hypothetical protein